MKIRVPKYFEEFNCIADKCPDTCCAGWGIVIDDESYEKYSNLEGAFGHRLRSEIVQEGNENIFVLKGNNCPFLDESNLCDIYKEVGAEGLCYTCRQYPRYLEEFGSLREIGISLSCPEAAQIILRNSNKVEFSLSENSEQVTQYNDINGNLFLELMQCRRIVIDMLQNRELSINIRAAIVLCFINEVQDKIDNSKISEIKEVRSKFLEEETVEEIIKYLNKFNSKDHMKYKNMLEIINIFKDLKHINPNDPLGLEDAIRLFWQNGDDEDIYAEMHKQFNEYYKDKEYKFEHILVYFTFRYFMKAVFDYDVLAKVKTAIVSYLMIKELSVAKYTEEKELTDNNMVDIAQRYSKDVEHLEENIEKLAELFESDDVFDIQELLVTLTN